MSAVHPGLTAHSLAIALSLLVYVLTTRAERERRPPAVAIAWVLGLIALPYVVLPAYLLFGRRKLTRRPAVPRRRTGAARHWAEELIESFGLPPAAPARVGWHHDGAAARAALHSMLDGARERLDVCTFILGDDDFGRETAQRLRQAARRGVEVRLLLDGVGALWLPRSRLVRLENDGVRTAVFSPLLARRTPSPRNLRNHRKWVIADRSRLWGGGRNLAGEYFEGTAAAPAWLDLSFDLRGPVAAAAADQFDSDWRAAGGAPARNAPPPSATATVATVATDADDTAAAQFVPSGPDQPEDTVQALLVDACCHARRRILAVTPYFVPDTSLETAIRLAARRGVGVDLCLPATSNHRLADFARNRSLRALAAVGVRVHLLPRMVHAKAVVFDQDLALCGSVNLDSRSLLLNYESAVAFYGERDVAWLARWIEALLPGAAPYAPRPPGLWRDVAEGLLLSVAYQL